MILTDITPMPFGKYKGQPMQDVPVNYLHWFWRAGTMDNDAAIAVKDYIQNNLSALRMENKDLIW